MADESSTGSTGSSAAAGGAEGVAWVPARRDVEGTVEVEVVGDRLAWSGVRAGDRLAVDPVGAPVAGGLALVRFPDGRLWAGAVARLGVGPGPGEWVLRWGPAGREGFLFLSAVRAEIVGPVVARIREQPERADAGRA